MPKHSLVEIQQQTTHVDTFQIFQTKTTLLYYMHPNSQEKMENQITYDKH
jgi:hypothetical protein